MELQTKVMKRFKHGNKVMKRFKHGNKEECNMVKFNIHYLTTLLVFSVIMVSCSSTDDTIETPQNPESHIQKYSMNIKASWVNSKATTRALSLEGNTLNATWATTENIYVKKGDTSLGTLSPQSNSATAILKGELTGDIAVNDNLSLTFPRSNFDYRNQDGTLTTIASTFDYATATAKVTAISGSSITADDVTFESQQAIVKFVFTEKGSGNAINARYIQFLEDAAAYNYTKLFEYTDPTYGDRYGSVTLEPTSSTWNANGGTGIVYVALNCKGAFDLKINITDTNEKSYTYSKSNVNFEPGKYYIINVALVPNYEMKNISSGNITVPSGSHYYVTGSSSSNRITLKDGAFLTLHNVSITTSSESYGPIECEGSAYIFIDDGTTNTLSATGSYASGIRTNSVYPSSDAGTLIIYGKTGVLNVSSAYGTGIGPSTGNSYYSSSDIIINGGVINASGGSSGAVSSAAIGASNGAYCRNITINGGTITATGGRLGAGIGTGSGSCGNITINGGTIVAKGFSHCAGIGSGFGGTCGNITIGSGITSVTASCGDTGLSEDAGISAPDYPVDCDLIGCGYQATCGTVTIDGVENATTSSVFTNLSSVVSTSKRINDTWTLTHK